MATRGCVTRRVPRVLDQEAAEGGTGNAPRWSALASCVTLKPRVSSLVASQDFNFERSELKSSATRVSDGYRDAGDIASLSRSGADQESSLVAVGLRRSRVIRASTRCR